MCVPRFQVYCCTTSISAAVGRVSLYWLVFIPFYPLNLLVATKHEGEAVSMKQVLGILGEFPDVQSPLYSLEIIDWLLENYDWW